MAHHNANYYLAVGLFIDTDILVYNVLPLCANVCLEPTYHMA